MLISYSAAQQQQQPATAAGSLFGSQTNAPRPTNSMFGGQSNTASAAQPAQPSRPPQRPSLISGAPFVPLAKLAENKAESPSIFASQPTSQANTTTGLFGNQPTSQASSSTGLFGGQSANQASSSTGLFGSKPATQASQSTSLFGGQPPAQTTSLFGGQPASQTTSNTGLFGGSSIAQPAPTNSLFGNQSTAQPAATNSLFGGQSTAQPAATNSLFGGQSTAQPAATNSLFGGQSTAQPAAVGGLFGNSASRPAATGGLFGSQSTSQPAATNNLFGGAIANQVINPMQNIAPQQPSLLSASRYSLGQHAPFTGRLSMGQGNATQPSTTPATKLNWENVRPTTRYTDLTDSAKEQLEAIDKLIQQQEAFYKQIDAFLPVHGSNMGSLQPDIKLIAEKVTNVEEALVTDAQGVQQNKVITTEDAKNVEGCERVGENLKLPAQYHYAPAARGYGASRAGGEVADNHDADLVGKYFTPATAEMRRIVETYHSNLAEIENHIQTIEASTIAQAQDLGRQRTRGNNSNASIKQLADTLRGFEGTILSTASKVGAAREAVNELVLARC